MLQFTQLSKGLRRASSPAVCFGASAFQLLATRPLTGRPVVPSLLNLVQLAPFTTVENHRLPPTPGLSSRSVTGCVALGNISYPQGASVSSSIQCLAQSRTLGHAEQIDAPPPTKGLSSCLSFGPLYSPSKSISSPYFVNHGTV